MKLCTWQKKGFSLTDATQKIDSINCSIYYVQHKNKFERLWKQLGTNQFIWCYSTKEDAVCSASTLVYKNHTLWELYIPEDEIFHAICSIAWSRILSNCRCCPPLQLRWAWQRADLSKASKVEEEFHQFWDSKKEEELWDILFSLDGIVTPCSTPLVRYPLNEKWISGVLVIE